MRSLWRILAAEWLGGEGSAALCGHSSPLDLFDPAFWQPRGKRILDELWCGVSRIAMLVAQEGEAWFAAPWRIGEAGAFAPFPSFL